MDKKLQQRLLGEIKKSGIPLELSVVRALRTLPETHVRQNVRYEKDGVIREIDALASLGLRGDDHRGHEHDGLMVDLVVECKQSQSKPWVFFEEPWDPLSPLGLVNGVAHYTDLEFVEGWSFLASCQHMPLASHHYNSGLPSSRSYFEAFHKDAGQDIFKAIQSVEHGKVHSIGRILTDNQLKKRSIDPPWSTRLLHGVIVFDGVLALAREGEDGFEISEVDHVLLRSDNLPTPPWGARHQDEVVIDVLHVSALGRYFDLLETDLDALALHVHELRKAGRLAEPFG